MGLKAKYTPQQIAIYLSHVFQNMEKKIIAVFTEKGDKFMETAKGMTAKEGGFDDQSGDLRSSIGYFILAKGNVIHSRFEGNAAGKEAAFRELASIPKIVGYQLIGIAGMDYAVKVESMGKNVITIQAKRAQTEVFARMWQIARMEV